MSSPSGAILYSCTGKRRPDAAGVFRARGELPKRRAMRRFLAASLLAASACTPPAGNDAGPADDGGAPTADGGGAADGGAVEDGGAPPSDAGGGPVFADAGVVDAGPADARWTAMSTTGAPSPRQHASAVWTGTHLIVWGGGSLEDGEWRSDGARYDPATDTWTPMSTTNAPPPRLGHCAAWTGTEMLVWGGHFAEGGAAAYPVEGGRYDPATDAWTAMPTAGAPTGRFQPVCAWTGTELFVWSGEDESFANPDTGALFDPATSTWSPVNTLGAPDGRSAAVVHVVAGKVVVFGGQTFTAIRQDGAVYDPALDTWSPMSAAGRPSPRRAPASSVVGDDVVVWGGLDAQGAVLSDGAAYDLATNAWIPLPAGAPPAGLPVAPPTAPSFFVVGGFPVGRAFDGVDVNLAARLDVVPDGGAWEATPPGEALGPPRAFAHAAAFWTGTALVVWGGGDDEPVAAGARFAP